MFKWLRDLFTPTTRKEQFAQNVTVYHADGVTFWPHAVGTVSHNDALTISNIHGGVCMYAPGTWSRFETERHEYVEQQSTWLAKEQPGQIVPDEEQDRSTNATYTDEEPAPEGYERVKGHQRIGGEVSKSEALRASGFDPASADKRVSLSNPLRGSGGGSHIIGAQNREGIDPLTTGIIFGAATGIFSPTQDAQAAPASPSPAAQASDAADHSADAGHSSSDTGGYSDSGSSSGGGDF